MCNWEHGALFVFDATVLMFLNTFKPQMVTMGTFLFDLWMEMSTPLWDDYVTMVRTPRLDTMLSQHSRLTHSMRRFLRTNAPKYSLSKNSDGVMVGLELPTTKPIFGTMTTSHRSRTAQTSPRAHKNNNQYTSLPIRFAQLRLSRCLRIFENKDPLICRTTNNESIITFRPYRYCHSM